MTKCVRVVPDPWEISLVGLNGGYLEDFDSDDEVKNYPQLVLTKPEGLLLSPVMILRKEKTVLGAGFYFTKIHVFKIRGGRVVDEKPRVASMAPVLEPIVSPSAFSSTNVVSVLVDVVGDSSPFSSGSTALAPAAGDPPMVEVRDDSHSSSPVVNVGSGSSLSFLSWRHALIHNLFLLDQP
ncbi:hypothetical protein Adt_23141 [Abeliophyllum distichum]|uniref:Uncharacterized protein n=1 Tax=Abeliophyllum distichum TaxID=126358 RepID=A0ABD1SAB8_9LAMI